MTELSANNYWPTMTAAERVEVCQMLAQIALRSMDAATPPEDQANLVEIADSWISLAQNLERQAQSPT